MALYKYVYYYYDFPSSTASCWLLVFVMSTFGLCYPSQNLVPFSVFAMFLGMQLSEAISRISVMAIAFNALTLLVEHQEVCQNRVIRCWHNCLSGGRCKQFAYGPADVTTTPLSLASLKSRMSYLSDAGLHRFSWEGGR